MIAEVTLYNSGVVVYTYKPSLWGAKVGGFQMWG